MKPLKKSVTEFILIWCLIVIHSVYLLDKPFILDLIGIVISVVVLMLLAHMIMKALGVKEKKISVKSRRTIVISTFVFSFACYAVLS